MNAYDLMAEIGVGSVQQDTRRFVAGRSFSTARHVDAEGMNASRMVEVEKTRPPMRHRLAPHVRTVVIASMRAAFGSALVRVGRRIRGAIRPDITPGLTVPLSRFGATRGDGQTEH